MDKVLIVEDDLALQRFLRTRLQKYRDKFAVIFADNGQEAIRILKKTHISLLVIDIVMPKLDGIALLNYINNKHPHIRCIVMTGHATPELEQRLLNDNVLCLYEKPFQLEEFVQTILQALEQDIPDGILKGISVVSFLQMIQLEQKTCLIEVHLPNKGKGLFLFREGVPHDAVYGDLIGEDAALKIIAMDKAEIRFMNFPGKKIPRRINRDLMTLIVEAMKPCKSIRVNLKC
jgi:CheY-like chemotaxis protein